MWRTEADGHVRCTKSHAGLTINFIITAAQQEPGERLHTTTCVTDTGKLTPSEQWPCTASIWREGTLLLLGAFELFRRGEVVGDGSYCPWIGQTSITPALTLDS